VKESLCVASAFRRKAAAVEQIHTLTHPSGSKAGSPRRTPEFRPVLEE
jgi:hypothetical protein